MFGRIMLFKVASLTAKLAVFVFYEELASQVPGIVNVSINFQTILKTLRRSNEEHNNLSQKCLVSDRYAELIGMRTLAYT